jgi:MFS family permease
MAALILTPLFASYKSIVIVSRLFTGIGQSLFFVFFPVWIDLHGEDQKSLWLSYIQLTSLSGYIFGFVFTAVVSGMKKNIPFVDWRFSFYFLVVSLGLMFSYLRKFDEKIFAINKN